MKYTNYIYEIIYKNGCCRSKERIRIYFKIRRYTKRFVYFKFIYFVLTYVLYICMFPACCFRQRTYGAQGLFNGALNETWTHSCFQYNWHLVWQTGLYRGRCFYFLECVYFCFTRLWFWYVYSCVCVCVCVGVGVVLGFMNGFFLCVSVYHREFCGFKFTGSPFSFFSYIYTYVCVCVCMCVYVFRVFFVCGHVWHKVYLMGIKWDFVMVVVWIFFKLLLVYIYIYIYIYISISVCVRFMFSLS